MSAPHPASLPVRTALLCAVAGVLAGCGISADQRVTHIPADELGGLANTTTTTTTTTSTTVPATVPVTSIATSLPPETTTTVEVVATQAVVVFYAPRGRDDIVKRVPVQQVGDPTLNDVIRLLTAPPPQVADSNLTTEVASDLVISTNMERLHTVVDLDPDAFERMSDANRRQAIAQLVLTLTSFVTPNRGPVASVVFTVGGEDLRVPLPGQGSSDPGEAVAFRDFESWIDSAANSTDTTTPSSSAATTDAPSAPGTTSAESPSDTSPASD